MIHKGAGAGRKQVALQPGHSMMDWIRLGNSKGRALAGVPFPRRITPEELALHNQVHIGPLRSQAPDAHLPCPE